MVCNELKKVAAAECFEVLLLLHLPEGKKFEPQQAVFVPTFG
jgi:hypothetical protein